MVTVKIIPNEQSAVAEDQNEQQEKEKKAVINASDTVVKFTHIVIPPLGFSLYYETYRKLVTAINTTVHE